MKKSKTKVLSNREVKSDAFTAHFSDPKNAAQLYSALEGVEVSPEEIRITTLEGVLFVARKNDLAFTAKGKVLVISEHQSTVNMNMPLRSAIYYGRTMEKLIAPESIYEKEAISIPTSQFYAFYNGNEHQPPETILKLSDSYLEKTTEPMLELIVRVININLPENHQILERCRPLYEYSWFIQKIKDYINSGFHRDDAVTQAVKDCDRAGILTEFMQEHRSEVINMLFTQFNMEDAMAYNYKKGEKKGRTEGRTEGKMFTLIQQVCRKLAKGKTVSEIAEDLEEEPEVIERICSVAQQCGPAADVEKIYVTLQDADA